MTFKSLYKESVMGMRMNETAFMSLVDFAKKLHKTCLRALPKQ